MKQDDASGATRSGAAGYASRRFGPVRAGSCRFVQQAHAAACRLLT
ncbi:hypothetical protein SB783_09535 [Paraburkholderia sp. SIMBA_009]